MDEVNIHIIYTIIKYLKPNQILKYAYKCKNFRLSKFMLKFLYENSNCMINSIIFNSKELSNQEIYYSKKVTNTINSSKYNDLNYDSNSSYLNRVKCDFFSFKTEKHITCFTIIDNDYIFCGHTKGSLSIYNLTSFQLVLRKNSHFSDINLLKYKENKNHKWVISCDKSGKIIIWRIIKNNNLRNSHLMQEYIENYSITKNFDQISILTTSSNNNAYNNANNFSSEIFLKEEKVIHFSKEEVTSLEICNLNIKSNVNNSDQNEKETTMNEFSLTGEILDDILHKGEYDEATSSSENTLHLNLNLNSISNTLQKNQLNQLQYGNLNNLFVCKYRNLYQNTMNNISNNNIVNNVSNINNKMKIDLNKINLCMDSNNTTTLYQLNDVNDLSLISSNFFNLFYLLIGYNSGTIVSFSINYMINFNNSINTYNKNSLNISTVETTYHSKERQHIFQVNNLLQYYHKDLKKQIFLSTSLDSKLLIWEMETVLNNFNFYLFNEDSFYNLNNDDSHCSIENEEFNHHSHLDDKLSLFNYKLNSICKQLVLVELGKKDYLVLSAWDGEISVFDFKYFSHVFLFKNSSSISLLNFIPELGNCLIYDYANNLLVLEIYPKISIKTIYNNKYKSIHDFESLPTSNSKDFNKIVFDKKFGKYDYLNIFYINSELICLPAMSLENNNSHDKSFMHFYKFGQ